MAERGSSNKEPHDGQRSPSAHNHCYHEFPRQPLRYNELHGMFLQKPPAAAAHFATTNGPVLRPLPFLFHLLHMPTHEIDLREESGVNEGRRDRWSLAYCLWLQVAEEDVKLCGFWKGEE